VPFVRATVATLVIAEVLLLRDTTSRSFGFSFERSEEMKKVA
jgi:hypothetical protein